jgi:uncharacterized protein (DUF4415 family)
VTSKWPSFETKDLPQTPEGDAEMQRRWEAYNRDMQTIIARGGVHKDADGWWVDDATGELIGPDPEIERPATDEELAQARPFAEALPEFAATMKRTRGPGKKPKKEVVTLRLDPDVIAAYKQEGEGWQSRINADLRKAKKLRV